MLERGSIYAFEGIPDDLPRPPMSALRALLSVGVVVSARAWQDLPPDTRHALAREGARDTLSEVAISELVRRIPVSQVKLVGKRADPDPKAIPPELITALGPVRPISPAEWAGLRALDRHVFSCLVKNTRLLAKALNEILPPPPGSGGIAGAWAGAVARTELRMKKPTIQRVLSADFFDGNGFVLANVAGRRAARRASELLDQQADSTVGPVELDWGLRAQDDVIFWQAHVSDWDGHFFPAAAMLATTGAATAMYDLVKTIDPTATIILSGIREEPWQAGREEPHDAATALYQAAGGGKMPLNQATIREERPSGLAPSLVMAGEVPAPRSSTPILSPSMPPAPRSAVPGSGPRSDPRSGPGSGGGKSKRPAWVGAAVVSSIVLVNLVVILAIAMVLTQNHH